MTLPTVFVTRHMFPEITDGIKNWAHVDGWQGEEPVPRDVLIQRLANVDGVLCLLTDRIDEAVLDSALKLRVISTMAVGVDHIAVRACTRRRIPVGHTPDVLTETSADCAFALLMCAARRLGEGIAYVKAGRWTSWSPTLLLGEDVYGKTFGIIGFGRIGQAMVKRARGFGMRILVAHSSPVSEARQKADAIEQVDLSEVLSESDFVSLHVPLTPATRHLINAQALRSMKKTAILINTSRGAVVDTMALYQALQDGTIRYAALDVTDPEPLPSDHPLLALSNCIVVPHIASASVATRQKMALLAVENLRLGLIGQRMTYCVNPEVYDEPAVVY